MASGGSIYRHSRDNYTPIEAYAAKRYAQMRIRNENRGHGPLSYTALDFVNWSMNNLSYLTLYDKYLATGAIPHSDEVPSVHRPDISTGYTLDNIVWISYGEHRELHKYDKSDSIYLLDMELSPVREFACAAEAQRALSVTNVNAICKGIKGQKVKHRLIFCFVKDYTTDLVLVKTGRKTILK